MTPIFEKMLIKQNTAYRAFGAPAFWMDEMHKNELNIVSSNAMVIHWFLTSKAQFDEGIQDALEALGPGGRLWISYRKETKELRFDIHRDRLAELARQAGLRPFRQVAINEDWSALGFVRAE